MSVVKPLYTSNWGDQIGYPVAQAILPYIAKIPGITPNKITVISFLLFTFGSISLFLSYEYHLICAAVLITIGYIGDDLDGQLARHMKLSSVIGDYLDKVLDVLKIFIITTSLGYASFIQTGESMYLLIGAAACFFFNLRYYIKLETMFSEMSRDASYLERSSLRKNEFLKRLEGDITEWNKTLTGKLKVLWVRNKLIFAVDEAEFALFTAMGALLNQLPATLCIIAFAQVFIAFWRFYERGNAMINNRDSLLNPMRK